MRRTAPVAALLAASLALPAAAAPPEPGWTATTSGLPVPLARGEWEETDDYSAELTVEAAALPGHSTTFLATWASPPVTPPRKGIAFRADFGVIHQRVTTGLTAIGFELRYRIHGRRWSKWNRFAPGLGTEVLTQDIGEGYSAAGFSNAPKQIEWEWRLTGAVSGADALQLAVTVAAIRG